MWRVDALRFKVVKVKCKYVPCQADAHVLQLLSYKRLRRIKFGLLERLKSNFGASLRMIEFTCPWWDIVQLNILTHVFPCKKKPIEISILIYGHPLTKQGRIILPKFWWFWKGLENVPYWSSVLFVFLHTSNVMTLTINLRFLCWVSGIMHIQFLTNLWLYLKLNRKTKYLPRYERWLSHRKKIMYLFQSRSNLFYYLYSRILYIVPVSWGRLH